MLVSAWPEPLSAIPAESTAEPTAGAIESSWTVQPRLHRLQLCNRLCYSMRGLVGCRKRQGRRLLSPASAGLFRGLSCRPPDTETNGSARRFVGGLPPMLEPHRCRFLWCGLRQAASPFLEVSEQKLSPASRRGFFCGRALCNQAPAAPLIERACRFLRRVGHSLCGGPRGPASLPA